jgi:hypothetical protein
MASSTARFISYDLRPAKQSERRILVDVLKLGGDCGLPIDTYRYVGMGANRFYDFLLLHKYLGLSNMTSLEHDPAMFRRAAFNVPYRFIDVQPKNAAEFIADDDGLPPSIYWLDYDGGISSEILADISSFSTKMKRGDFCFVTVAGEAAPFMEKLKGTERLSWFQDNLGEMAGDVTIEDMEKSSFYKAIHKVLMAAFRNAFAPRREGKFVPLLQVFYSDSMRMVTAGGAFVADGTAVEYRDKVKRVMPFLNTTDNEIYPIRSLYLTERERSLFDRAVTSTKERSAEMRMLKMLGFKESELTAYKDLVRYLPRYVETIV